MRRLVSSKWKKTKALMNYESLRLFIPLTKIMDKDSLLDMLQRYQMVYIKPVIGTHGIGVMRLDLVRTEVKTVYQLNRLRSFSNYNDLYSYLVKMTKGRTYLVQKGIHLLKYHHNSFDIRVMVQKNLRQQWETTGMIGRVAKKGSVVTNFHNGGMLKSVPSLLSSYIAPHEISPFTKRLHQLGLETAKRLEEQYPGVKEVGLDIGVDHQLHPWIIEVNTTPDPYLFRALKDPNIFRKIRIYQKAYGRE